MSQFDDQNESDDYGFEAEPMLDDTNKEQEMDLQTIRDNQAPS